MSLTENERTEVLRRIREKIAGSSRDSSFSASVSEADGASSETTKVQQQIAYLSELNPDAASYTTGFALEFYGDLKIEVLESCIQNLADRHEALRTRFFWEREVLKRRVQPHIEFNLEVRQTTSVELASIELASKVFNIEQMPLWRAVLLEEGEFRKVLVWTASHAIFDGFSMIIVADELSKLYRGHELAPVELQLSDLSKFEQSFLESENFDQLISYWKSVVQPDKVVSLADKTNHRHSRKSAMTISQKVPEETIRKVDDFARSRKTTRSTVLLSIYIATLSRLTGRENVTVGVPLDGRYRGRLRAIVGNLVNTVPIQVSVSTELSFDALVEKTGALLTGAIEHQALPLSVLIDELSPERDGTAPPLFATIFNFSGLPSTDGFYFGPLLEATLTGVSNASSRFDYELSLDTIGDSVHVRFEYDIEKVSSSRADAIVSGFAGAIEHFVVAPAREVLHSENPSLGRLPLANDISARSRGFGNTSPDVDHRDVLQVIEPIWRQTLGADCSTDRNFFAEGGTSLVAVPMVKKMSEALNFEVPLVEALTAESLLDLAKSIASLQRPVETR